MYTHPALFAAAAVLHSVASGSVRPVDRGPPGPSVHGALQARILEWVAMPSSKGSSLFRDRTRVSCASCTAGGFFTARGMGQPRAMVTEVAKESDTT